MPRYEQVERARGMRRRMTKEEAFLWKHLRRNALGVEFRRQHPIGPYIADFACPEARLIVEVDGSQHVESVYDQDRDDYLYSQGWWVLRFHNEDVWRQMFWTLHEIRKALAARIEGYPKPES